MSASKTPLTDAVLTGITLDDRDSRIVALLRHARALESDHAAMREALEYIARGYSGTVEIIESIEGHSGTHCVDHARAVLAGLKVRYANGTKERTDCK